MFKSNNKNLSAIVVIWWIASGLYAVITKHYISTSSDFILVTHVQFILSYLLGKCILKFVQRDEIDLKFKYAYPHLIGTFVSNFSMIYCDVFLIQSVKTLEPLICIIIMALFYTKKYHAEITFRKGLCMIGVVIGSLITLNSFQIDNNSIFPLLSSIAVSLQFIIIKTSTNHSKFQWFTFINKISFQISCYVVIIAFLNNSLRIGNIPQMLLSGIFFFLYNSLSLFVLHYVDVSNHSILKIGKRVAVLVFVYLFLQETLNFVKITGLAISFTCMILANNNIGFQQLSKNTYKTCLFDVFIIVFVLFMGTKQFDVMNDSSKRRNLLSHCPINEKGWKQVVVWTYPFSPLNETLHKCDEEEVFYCAHKDCFNQVPNATQINLKELTFNTKYHSFVTDHALQKISKGQEFIHHIQSVAVLSLLAKNKHLCVRVPGIEELFCRFKNRWNRYDPNEEFFIPPIKSVTPSLEIFSVLDYQYRVIETGVANSGDEIQSLAAAQFIPYHTSFVERDVDIPFASGFMIGNAWYGDPFYFPPSDELKPTLVSVHYSQLAVQTLEEYQYWFQNHYVPKHGAVGARDEATLQTLRNFGIKSYLSSCLTTMLQVSETDDFKNRKRIIIVDPIKVIVPEFITGRSDARFKRAHVPYKIRMHRQKRYEYANNLLHEYKNRAKVVITSRIHSALPALAQRIPVIFVDGENLPGGPGNRTAGIKSLFHVFNNNSDWTKFDFENPPPNPGNHKVDRYRASFWNKLKSETHWYKHTALMFGMIPLVRLGRGPIEMFFEILIDQPIVENDWLLRKTLESIYYFHPNAHVSVHTTNKQYIDIFKECGYYINSDGDNSDDIITIHYGQILTRRVSPEVEHLGLGTDVIYLNHVQDDHDIIHKACIFCEMD